MTVDKIVRGRNNRGRYDRGRKNHGRNRSMDEMT